jgi:hypothetical protein
MRTPFFSVIERPVYYNMPESPAVFEIPRKKVLINSETGNVLSVVSEDYQLIHNRQVADAFNDAFSTFHVDRVSDSLDSTGARWRRDIIFDDPALNTSINGNDFRIMINAFNAYNGKNAYGFSLSAYRLICLNGLKSFQKIFNATFSHMTNAVDSIRSEFSEKLALYSKQFELWKTWNEIPFTKTDFEKFVDNNQKMIGKKFAKEIKDSYDVVLRRYGDKPTKYGAIQCLTWHQTHNVKSKKVDDAFASKSIQLDNLIKAFYNLPEPTGVDKVLALTA